MPRGDRVGRRVGATYGVAATPAPERSRGEAVKAVGCSCRRWRSGCAALPPPAVGLEGRLWCVAAWRARGEGGAGDVADGGAGSGRGSGTSGASGTSDTGIALARRRCSVRASISAKRQSLRHIGHVVLLSIHLSVHFSQKRCWHGRSLHASPIRKLVRHTGQSVGRPFVVLYLVLCRAAYSAVESPLPDGVSSGGPAPVMCM